ncbi:ATP-binding protein [uncultured Thiohalocapsa sp.]|uniref:ATP-binding protein n=1 Tax=uncultured Thiohalocapsa sp. TaxID=768990 RepID=UPI0025FC5FEC|nr:ATP-binding protein [uncultured Thiohalocapsa sp.]
MWIEREISSELTELARRHPVLVLTASRQVGKTSLLERLFTGHRYVTLDLASNAEMAESRPAEFLRLHPPPLLVDEVQYAPGFLRDIKTTVDARRGENGLFVLTGSQNFLLMERVADSLAGRAAVIPFLGLSAREWAASRQPPSADDWMDFLWRGAFPALWAAGKDSPGRDRWYQGYVATYLERDVRSLANVGNLRDFERLLRAAAARCAQTLNMSELARDVGVSPSTARQWIGVLEASNQVLLLEPYHRSLGKRLAKSPKLYFTDTGLASFLMGFQSADALRGSPLAGALWENYVIVQWLRWRDWTQPAAALWYWRNQSGDEVDLLIEHNARLYPVECKLAERPGGHATRGIQRLRQLYGDSVARAFIACTTETPFDIAPGITAVNGWQTWALDD